MPARLRAEKTPWLLLLVFVLLSAGIAAAGLSYYSAEKAAHLEHQRSQLAAIADLKIGQIEAWRTERLGDARIMRDNALVNIQVEEFLDSGAAASHRSDILAWMESRVGVHDYAEAVLVAPDGSVRLASPPTAAWIGPIGQAMVDEVLQTGEPAFSDLHRAGPEAMVHLDVVIPLRVEVGGGPRPIGVLILRIDPSIYLFPLIQSWPTSSPSAETVLVRREGDEVLYLNELRHAPDPALTLTRPTSQQDLPAALAVQGVEGIVQGVDYRGMPVIAALRQVPNTSWFMVAEVGRDEILAPMVAQGRLVGGMVAILVFAAAASIALLWRIQRAEFARKHYEAQLERKVLTEHFGYLSKYANDAILLADEQGRILEANERAQATYGYAREELLELNLADLRPLETREALASQLQQVAELGGSVFETLHARKGGTTFPAEVSARIIAVEGKRYYQGIIRDITERKMAGEALRESKERYESANRATFDAIWDWNLQTNAVWWNENFQTLFGYRAEEIEPGIESWTNRIHPEDLDRVEAGIHAAIDSGRQSWSDQYRFRRKDGVYAEIHDRGYIGREASGIPARMIGAMQDITERKRAEEALRQRAEEMAALQATVLGITAPHDLPDLLQTITERAVRLLNADGGGLYLCDPGRQEVRCLVSYSTPRDYTGTVLKYGQGAAGLVAQTGEPLIIDDYRIWDRRADVFEKERPFSAVLSVPMIWQGQVTGVIHVLRSTEGNPFTQADLGLLRLFANHAAIATENTRLLLGLQAERDNAQQYLDIAGVIIVAINADQKVALINKKGCLVLGYTAQEIMGKNWFETCIPEKESEQVKEVFNRLMAGEIEPIEYIENAVLTKSGEGRLIAWQNAVLRDSAGNIVGTLSSGNDVTDRRLAEEALRDSEAELRALFAAMTDVVIVYDTDGRNIKIAPTNPINLYRPLDGMLGKSVHDILPKEQADYIVAKVGEAIQTGRVVTGEYALQIGGKEIWFASSASRLSENTAVWVAHDITERKRAEAGLRDREAKLSAIYSAAPVGIGVDVNRVIQEINDTLCRITGYSREELIGHNSRFLFLTQEDYESVGLEKYRQIAECRSEFVETRLKRKDGRIIDTLLSAVPLDAADLSQGVTFTVLDITERKRAEDALRESEAALQKAQQVAHVGSWTWRIQEDRLEWSQEMHRIFGIEKESFTGDLNKVVAHAIHPDDRAAVEQANISVRRDGKPVPLEYRVVWPDGTIRVLWAEAGELVLDADGKAEVLTGIVQDITERVRAEEALRESENRLHTIAEGTQALLVSVDANGHFTYANDATARAVGYASPNELIGKPYLHFIHHEDRQQVLANFINQVNTHQPSSMQEFRIKDTAGNVKWFSFISTLVIKDGKFVGQSGVAQDITARKRADEEIQRRAAYLESLNTVIGAAAAAPDLPVLLEAGLHQILKAMGLKHGAIFVRDCLVSRGFPDVMLQELKNLLPTHELAMTDRTLMIVKDWQQPPPGPLERLAPISRGIGIDATLAVAITTESGPVGVIAVASLDPHPWSSEEVVLLEGIARQLGTTAERLNLLQQTESQASQLQHILDKVPEGILTVDQDRKVALANPLASECLETLAQYGEGGNLLGLSGRPLSELLIPRSDGLPHEVVVPGPRPRIFEIQSSPVELTPGGGGQTLILNEVTEQREKRRVAEHQERLAAIGQLAAGIAHDFNNIIAAIILHSELMLAEPGLSDKGLMRQKTILQQAHRAASLTQQVLDFSRRAVLELRPIELAPFVKETLKLLQRTLPESVQVSLSIEPGEYTIRADPARIQQVFMNLALNARDSMPGGGQLRFELSHMRAEPDQYLPFSDMAVGEWLVAKVEDTGTGISPDVLPHIFEPFFTTKPQGEGTGLGLSQVFGIVKQHGGFIDVGSRAGEGTTFTIYLPALTRQEAIVIEAQVTGAPRGDGETILVVEDNASTRVAVCEILESLDYHTLQAADGEEALAVFGQHADGIDLVVSDLVMPVMGGRALYGALRQRRPDLKLILMTGYPLGGGTRELLEDQEVSWLQKPLTTLGLAEAVHKALTGKGT